MKKAVLWSLAGLWMMAGSLSGCAEDSNPLDDEFQAEQQVEELGIGAIDDLKADGGWGLATTCKAIPQVETLQAPQIVVSLDGLTLRLFDETSGYDRVFPIGPGAIEDDESLTPTSLNRPDGRFTIRLDQPVGKETSNSSYAPWAYAYSCRIWWTDPASKKKVPVFAGLPFLRLEGAPTLGYAIHGPIDSYTQTNGGRLTRGFVSHGCIRMEAADVLEVYGRCLGKKVPVTVQKAVERREDGTAVDVDDKWILSECRQDSDCNFEGGVCHSNPYSGHNFCTKECTRYCPDRTGYPTSFCVADPEDDTRGICTLKGLAVNHSCKRYPGWVQEEGVGRFGQSSVTASVCLPGSAGWIGSPCFSDLDCASYGMTCHQASAEEDRPGYCTQSCAKYCPDADGEAGTFCVDASETGGECVQRCAVQDDCPSGYSCQSDIPRYNQTSVTADVCL